MTLEVSKSQKNRLKNTKLSRFIRGLFPSSNPLSVYEKLFQPLSHHPAQVSRILRDKKSGGRARRLELAQFIGFIKFLERGDGRKKEKKREREREKEKPWRKNEWTKSRGRQGGVEKFTSAFQRRKEIRCTTVLWRLIIAVIKMRGSCARGRGAN